MQHAAALDAERLVRLHEAAFNLAARIRDFTVYRNLFSDHGTLTRCEPGRDETSCEVARTTRLAPRTAVLLFREVVDDGDSVQAGYFGSGWPQGLIRGRAIFTLDDNGLVADLRLEEHAARPQDVPAREAVLA